MRYCITFLAAALSAVASTSADVKVLWERNDDATASGAFRFKTIGSPQRGDVGTNGTLSVLSGAVDPNSGGLKALNDGRVPREDDAPNMNFFFAAGTKGGRLLLDLGKQVPIGEVRSFSWHPADRGPQVYKLYAMNQAAADPSAAGPGDLNSLGWRQLANVDTRKEGAHGGQFGVSIRDTAGKIGDFRYLIFDIAATENRDAFGNTFFSEIDVIAVNAEEEKASAATAESISKSYEFGNYRLTVDTSAAPDLREWSESKLVPVVKEWYPKLVEMLPSEGYHAATNIAIRFREDMGGTPASAGGSRINCNAQWFRKNLKGEAVGSVVHEMVHVVQNYGWGRRNNPNATRVPGWIVEGIPDYIRWFLYEPETHGAEITLRNLDRAKYDGNYRISGNFLDWVARKHGKEVIWKINAAAREGKYSPDIWKELTGKSVEELGAEWRAEHEVRLRETKKQ